jgi:hypothetical protein
LQGFFGSCASLCASQSTWLQRLSILWGRPNRAAILRSSDEARSTRAPGADGLHLVRRSTFLEVIVEPVQLAAVLAAGILVASFVSVELGTFGTISSLFGLNAGIIDRTQFSLLVTVVDFSAIVPTAIAERSHAPELEEERRIDRRVAAVEAEEYV